MKYLIDERSTILWEESKYYLRIRSCNKDNPIVLFLHGGCGSPDRAQVMKFQSPLAQDFTLVCWDQRGTGLAYDKREAKSLTLTKELYVEDAHNVVLYLKKRFNKTKIIIVGHSFGSVLGVWLAQKYPQDIEAYVGVGQCVDYIKNEELSYDWAYREAKRINDKTSIKILNEIGFPLGGKYSKEHQKSLMKQRAVLHKLGGATYANRKPYWQELLFHEVPIMLKEYSIFALIKYIKGLSYSPSQPLAHKNPDFLNTAKELQVPVYLLLGHHDQNCPYQLAEEWYKQLNAPTKKLVWFENSAHSPQWEESQKWNDEFKNIFIKEHNISLERATVNDAKKIWEMQATSFAKLLEKYQDFDTNPGAETLERVEEKLNQPYTYFYLIKCNGDTIGAIRIKDKKLTNAPKSISPIFILPQYRNCGYAQYAIKQAEALHGATNWVVDTILQEPNLCHFYENLGYRKTPKQKTINSNLTLIYYIK
ncbi:MAG: alpha/beta fold hydrolase [Clostridia bacterium]|nr:alpha/beta fold hydrolase [Clostridia bacterium]